MKNLFAYKKELPQQADFNGLDWHELAAGIIGYLDRMVALLRLHHANTLPVASRLTYTPGQTQSIHTALQRESFLLTAISASAATTVTLTVKHKNLNATDAISFVLDLAANQALTPVQEFIIPRDGVLQVTSSGAATVAVNGTPYQLPDQSLLEEYRV